MAKKNQKGKRKIKHQAIHKYGEIPFIVLSLVILMSGILFNTDSTITGQFTILDNDSLILDNISSNMSNVNFSDYENVTKEANIKTAIKDSRNRNIRTQIEIQDINGTKYSSTESNHNINLVSGKYKVKIKPQNHKIKEIVYDDIYLDSNITNIVEIDEVEDKYTEYKKVFAINPTYTNFTNATVTSVAEGTSLYKCKDWDFESQECYGEWELFKTGLVPGEEYSFILTPDDPGFAEYSGNFIENWESGTETTNGWTITSGPTSGWYVTTDESPIDSYHAIARDIDGETTLELELDTTDYENVVFGFYWSTDSNAFDSGEYFYADWYDGTTWNNLFSLTSGKSTTYQQEIYNLPSTAEDNPDFKIRFRCNANLGSEGCNVDNITISGSEIDLTPPGTISNLNSLSQTNSSIYWSWTNPVDADFAANIIFINNNNIANTSNNYYNATGLNSNTQYTIKVHTKDTTGNVNNTDITNTNKTLKNFIYAVSLIDPSDLVTAPNTNVTYSITITNEGNMPDDYILNLTNYDSIDIAELNQSSISNLNNGSSTTFDLTIGHSSIGNYTVGVKATSQNDPSKYDTINITTGFTSSTVYGVGLTYIEDQETSEYVNAEYNITVTNTGTDTDNITVSLTNVNNANTATLNQSTIYDLGASEQEIITLTVGDTTPGTYLITLNASSLNDPNKYDLLNVTTTILDTTPPSSITNLQNISSGLSWLYWTWTNPVDADFAENIIYINNNNIANTSNNYYNATGLTENTEYTIKIFTIDNDNNINTTLVENIAKTNTNDPINPVINYIDDTPDPIAKGNILNITANVTDNVNVSDVWANIGLQNYSMTQDTGSIGEVTSIYADGFESGSITSWTLSGAGAAWYIDTSNPNIDTFHITALKTQGESIISKTISTADYQDITFKFYAETSGLDPADYFRVDWYNGTEWIQLLDAEDINSYTEYSYNLPNVANDNPNLGIRFKCSSGNNEYCYVDDVEIIGKPVTKPQLEIWKLSYNTSSLNDGINYYTIYANDTVNNIASQQSDVTVIGDPVYTFTTDQPANQTVDNQTNAYYYITINNTGNVQDTYTLDVINTDNANTATLNQSSITIPSSSLKSFRLTVADTTIGNYTIGVNITSNGNTSLNNIVYTTTNIIPYVAPPTKPLLYDDFESGLFATNNWILEGTGDAWFIETSDSSFGTYHAEAGGTSTESILRNNISTINYGFIELSFYWDTDLLDGGEYLGVDWYNGTNWNNLLTTNSDEATYQYVKYDLPEDANNKDDFAIRFRCLSNLNSEECKIDNVQVIGVDIRNPAVNIILPNETEYNQYDNISINATVTDNINVSKVFANITWGSNSQSIELTDLDSDDIYTGLFANTSEYGLYRVTITANDTTNNINNTEYAEFEILSEIELINPVQNDMILERLPTFSWYNATGGTTRTYDLQISESSDFNTVIINATGITEGQANITNYTIVDPLELYTDYYWRVRVVRDSNPGQWSEAWNFSITKYMAISLPVNSVNLGTLVPDEQYNTTSSSTIVVQNDGNDLTNISIYATDMFTTQPNPSSFYQFAISANESNSYTSAQETFTNMLNYSTTKYITGLNWLDTNDTARIEIKVIIPSAEPPAERQSIITVVGES